MRGFDQNFVSPLHFVPYVQRTPFHLAALRLTSFLGLTSSEIFYHNIFYTHTHTHIYIYVCVYCKYIYYIYVCIVNTHTYTSSFGRNMHVFVSSIPVYFGSQTAKLCSTYCL
jgi:hypothetical protein